MRLSKTIEAQLKRLGTAVTFLQKSERTTVYAVAEESWKRNKSHFEDNASKAGRYYNDYYHYIGPASFDITSLGYEDYAEIQGEKYYFVRKEAVHAGDALLFYRGVLKKAEEADGNVFAG